MSDMDVFSAMGIAGFGKAPQKRQLDPRRFDKNIREEVCVHFISSLLQVYTLTCKKNSLDSEGHFKYTESNCCRTFADTGQYSNCGRVYP